MAVSLWNKYIVEDIDDDHKTAGLQSPSLFVVYNNTIEELKNKKWQQRHQRRYLSELIKHHPTAHGVI